MAFAPHAFGDAAVGTRDEADARRPSLAFPSPALAADVKAVTVASAMSVHLFGHDIRIVAAENSSTVRTGSASDASVLGARTDRVVVLEGRAVLTLAGEASLRADRLAGRLSGEVRADGAQGSLRDEGAVYAGAGEPHTLRGRLDVAVMPLGQDSIELDVFGGDLESTTLTRTAAPVRPVAAWIGAWGGILLAAVAASVAGSALLRKASVRTDGRRADAESLVARAEEALELGSVDQARALLEDAAKLAPSSTRIRFDLAYLSWRTGDHDAALALLAGLEPSPERAEALLLGARILAARGDEARAAKKLVTLLAESPVMLLELECPELAHVAKRNDVAKAVADATRALGP